MLRRKTLTIRRDDHLDDVIGAAFFESDANAGTTIADCIRNYLGRRITLVRAEVGSRDALVTVEARGFTVESERMLEEAAILWRGGARRSAIATAQQAIDLDPLNADAHVSMGEYLIDHKKPGPALQALKRAREIGGDSAEVLRNMGRACVLLERNASAVVYFKRALIAEPRDFVSLRALAQLGYENEVPKTIGKRTSSGVIRSGRS